ncbi:MAG: hypothetical protein RMY34_01405 [Aulosira sp. DedQUE10]|nr:hypothetical protein [Aulosira sp. DedQUE10]
MYRNINTLKVDVNNGLHYLIGGEGFTRHKSPPISTFKNGQSYSMFTRSELEIKTIGELRNLCRRYGLKPLGRGTAKADCVIPLLAFPEIAIRQMIEGIGLKKPRPELIEAIAEAMEQMSEPTPEQSAVLRATLEGRRMSYPSRYDQEKIYALYRAKGLLEQVSSLLSL